MSSVQPIHGRVMLVLTFPSVRSETFPVTSAVSPLQLHKKCNTDESPEQTALHLGVPTEKPGVVGGQRLPASRCHHVLHLWSIRGYT